MRIFYRPNRSGWLAASLALACMPAFAGEPEGVVRLNTNSREGVVRISDASRALVVRGQSPEEEGAPPATSAAPAGTCEHGVPHGQPCPNCQPDVIYEGSPAFIPPFWSHHSALGHGPLCEYLAATNAAYRTRNMIRSEMVHHYAQEECAEKSAWMHHKFGYFIPSGCCGKGCPPIGCYGMVYPVDPNYFDARDGQVYAAASYGGPVAVPLAPVVNHTYNYGWGIPSSRLTPVSHPTPVVRPVPLPIAHH